MKAKFEEKCNQCGRVITGNSENTLIVNKTLHEKKHQVKGY
jgi:hypothetical protein